MAISSALGEERELSLSTGALRVRRRGNGPTLVFVHGVVVNGDLWRGVVTRLADRYECVVPDLPLGAHTLPMRPGADLSTPALADLVVELLDALGIERATLIGNDTGGAVCQVLLARRPDRVERLVLTSCDAYELFPPPAARHLPILARIPGALWLTAQTLRLRAMQRSPLAYGPAALTAFPPAIAESYLRPSRTDAAIRRDLGKALRGLDPGHTLAAARTFADRHQPALIAWSRDDRLFPWSLGERLAAALPAARLVAVEDSRAFSPEDQPAALAAAIRAFLVETDEELLRAVAT